MVPSKRSCAIQEGKAEFDSNNYILQICILELGNFAMLWALIPA